jgi:tripartite-type tricarboxylate transporter receptor subunit TctC
MPVAEDVPSVVRRGLQLVVEEWVGWWWRHARAPSRRLNEATNKALAIKSVRDAFAKIAAEPAGGSPAEFGETQTQIAHWGKVVKDAGIKIRE